MKKCILFNLLFSFLLLLILELIGRYAYLNIFYKNIKFEEKIKKIFKMEIIIPNKFSPNSSFYTEKFKTFKKNSSKKPICFVGCSYTEGMGLNYDETFAYKISKLTNRTVYLRGKGGTGLAFVYYQIAHKMIPNDVEYIIYTYINDHQKRLYTYTPYCESEMNLRYKINKNGQIKQINSNFGIFYSLYFVQIFQNKIAEIKREMDKKEYKLFKAIMSDLIVQMKKNYPDTKFVFLAYQEDEEDEKRIPTEISDFVKNLDCIYLDADELSGEKLSKEEWKSPKDKIHPSSQAWDKVAPNFIKALNL